MARLYVRCARCRKIGVTAEMLGHCRNAGLLPAGLTKAEAQRRDLHALKRRYRGGKDAGTEGAPTATKLERIVAWLRSWLPE